MSLLTDVFTFCVSPFMSMVCSETISIVKLSILAEAAAMLVISSSAVGTSPEGSSVASGSFVSVFVALSVTLLVVPPVPCVSFVVALFPPPHAASTVASITITITIDHFFNVVSSHWFLFFYLVSKFWLSSLFASIYQNPLRFLIIPRVDMEVMIAGSQSFVPFV